MGEVSTQLVTALPRTGDENNKVDRVMVDVTVDVDGHGKGDEVIESTAGHAFWTNLTEPSNDGAKWVPARDLVSGAWLRTSSGTWVQATALTTETRPVNTYNLSVSQTHTYYVQTATADALVHNCEVKEHSSLCKCKPDEPRSEVTLDFSSFEQARNYGLDLIGKIDLASRSSIKGRLGSAVETLGRVTGFKGRSDGAHREFRLDVDPEKGTHINVMTGKGQCVRKWALRWPGTSVASWLVRNA